jgi:hypothetical protein
MCCAGNDIGDEGVSYLAAALRVNKTLKEINLESELA